MLESPISGVAWLTLLVAKFFKPRSTAKIDPDDRALGLAFLPITK